MSHGLVGGLKSTNDLHSIVFEYNEDCFGDLALFSKVTAELSMSHLSMCGMGHL